ITTALAVATLAQFADAAPDEHGTLGTQDGVFTGVLQRDATDAAQLLAEHAGKCLALIQADEPIAEKLDTLADTPTHWQAVLASLEDGRDYTDGPESEAGKVLRSWQPSASAELQARLGSPPRLSQTPAEIFALVWQKRNDLSEAMRSLPAAASGLASAQSLRPAGDAALSLLRGQPIVGKTLGDIEAAMRLRVEMARHLIEVRKVAKVETLLYKWPQAAQRALSNRNSIRNVESYLLREAVQTALTFSSDEERDLYEMCQSDPQFKRFLKLRPYFSDIPLFQYLTAAPLSQIAATTTTATPPPRPSTQPTTQPEETTAKVATTQAQTPTQAPPGEHATYVFAISGDPKAFPNPAGEYKYTVKISTPEVGLAPFDVEVDWARLSIELIKDVVGQVTDGVDTQPLLSRMFSQTDREYLFRVVRAGQQLYKKFFSDLGNKYGKYFEGGIRQAFNAERNVRVVIETDLSWIMALPWEWLSFPHQENFILSDRHSLVRSVPGNKSEEDEYERPLTPPLRVLIVVPSYSDSMRGEVEKRVMELQEMFGQNKGVKTKTLYGGDVTVESIGIALFDFIPHVLHFEGQFGITSAMTSDPPQPFIALPQKDTSLVRQFFLPELEDMLKTAAVQLLVLQLSPFFPFFGNWVPDLASGLVKSALPAVIAPVRNIEDSAALEFMRGFYRTALDGQRLETAVGRARLELLSKGGDWSAYALFSSAETLQRSPVLPSVW
ncbi:MAG: CHAT domain-containing protein, partial [Rubrivivax sp.]|nr:CHAT domain-containing protein [Pyrinomonadaceae bacterium]